MAEKAKYEEKGPNGDYVCIEEDSRKKLPDGRVEVRGTWVMRGRPGEHYRKRHTRDRPRRR